MNGGPPMDSRGGYDRGRNDYDDKRGGGGGGYSDRSGGFTGSNREPVRPRDGGYGDRDRGQGRDDNRKRAYEGDSYEDPRKLRRY